MFIRNPFRRNTHSPVLSLRPRPRIVMLLITSGSEDGLDRQTQDAHAGEAQLSTKFANGLRTLIRHKLPGVDPEPGVGQVLRAVARAAGSEATRTDAELAALVRSFLDAFIREFKARPEYKAPIPEARFGGALPQMNSQEREVLTRFYRDGQTEQEISEAMKTPPQTVQAVRKRARKRFQDRT